MSHPCEEELVCKSTSESVPMFNAYVYLENKQLVGKVDEIFGPIRDFVSFVKIYLRWCCSLCARLLLIQTFSSSSV